MGAARHLRLGRADPPRERLRPGSGPQRRRAGRHRDRPVRRPRRPQRAGTAAGRPDHRRPRHPGADRPLRARHRDRAAVVVPAVQRARGRLRPGRADHPGRARTGTSGSSTGRKCGRRSARAPTWPCSSPAPTPTCPSTRGSPTSPSICTSPGVEVRPLREMTGHAMFNEVFLTDARVPTSAIIGGRNNGWAVANTTLGHERAGLGAGGGSAGVAIATPGTVAGNLERRAGDFVAGRRPASGSSRTTRARLGTTARHARPAHRPGPGQRFERRPLGPPGPGPAVHPRGAGSLQRRAAQGHPLDGRRHPRHGQHRQAVHEQHRASPARRRPRHRRGPGHAARLRQRGPEGRSTRPPAIPSWPP